MSSQDLHQLAQNLEQLQPAGLTRQEWIWVGDRRARSADSGRRARS